VLGSGGMPALADVASGPERGLSR